MSYYNDARDTLEAAYPTCTSFLRYHRQPTIAGLQRRARGVAMVLSFALPSVPERFNQVCYGLEDSVPWSQFRFDVYDFAGIAEVLPILAVHGSVRGAGELFWVAHGEIIGAMTEQFEWPRFDALTERVLKA